MFSKDDAPISIDQGLVPRRSRIGERGGVVVEGEGGLELPKGGWPIFTNMMMEYFKPGGGGGDAELISSQGCDVADGEVLGCRGQKSELDFPKQAG